MKIPFIAVCLIMVSIVNLYAQYDEKYRPQFHFSAKNSSMADPKGLFILDGKYHIYWYGQWEHAISTDLIHWKEFPKPMKGAPGQFSYFSGSVVIDKNNTSGFGNNSAIAVYTRHFAGDSLPETQSISVSNDGGMSFQYYDNNPVLDINSKSFRDPQVFWHEPTRKWKMVVALANLHQIPVYESADLKNWEYCSTFGDLGATNAAWECPDLFELPVLGEKGKKKWVMIIGRGPNRVQYFTGDFDGRKFIPDSRLYKYLKNGTGLPGVVFDDFENPFLINWTLDGDAFKPRSDTASAINYLGHGFAGNLSNTTTTGTMKSKSFTIRHNAINFLIAGGQSDDSLCIRLVVGGKVVRSATGDNTRIFRWRGWDVRDLSGKQAHLEIVDVKDKIVNGSIAIDHILFTDNLLNLQAEHALWLDYGEDFYATRTWRNYDTNKKMGDSVILISWLGNWKYARISPTSWGTGFQSVPRTIALKKFPEGIRLVQEPIPALKELRTDGVQFTNKIINGTEDIRGFKPGKNTYEIEAIFNTRTSSVFGFNFFVGEGRKLKVSYDPKLSSLCADRTNCTDFLSNTEFTKKFAVKMFAPVKPEGNLLKLHIFVDQSSIEIFTNQGKEVLSLVTFPSPAQTGIEVFSEKGRTKLLSFRGWKISSIW